jgi:hypothetical protein
VGNESSDLCNSHAGNTAVCQSSSAVTGTNFNTGDECAGAESFDAPGASRVGDVQFERARPPARATRRTLG